MAGIDGGGTRPRWRADGKELYFIAPDAKLMAASVTVGATFAAGTPVALFPVNVTPGAGINRQQYVVSNDGRFLVISRRKNPRRRQSL